MTKYLFFNIYFLLLISFIASCNNEQIKPDISEKLYPIEVDGEYGYMDKTGKVVIEPQFDYVGYFSGGLSSVLINHKWGFINQKGEIVIPAIYDSALFFEGELAHVEIDKKHFYINKKGKYFLDYIKEGKDKKEVYQKLNRIKADEFKKKYEYKYLSNFSEGLASASKDINKKWGFVDNKGKYVIAAKYDFANAFSNGLAAVYIDGLWGFINKNDELVIKPKYDFPGKFDENGIAHVYTPTKTGFIDGNGDFEIILDHDHDCHFYTSNFNEGMAVIYKEYRMKSGFIDKKGKVIVEPTYYFVRPFSGGLASVKNVDKKTGFIDKTGTVVIEQKYLYASQFKEGRAYVSLDDGYRYIDKEGEFVTKLKFKKAKIFSEGLAAVQDEEGKWGFIDKSGKYMIESIYSYADSFSEGLAVAAKDGKRGFVNKEGEFKVFGEFEYIGSFSEGLAKVGIDNKCGYINRNGELVIKNKFDKCRKFSSGVARVKVGDKKGFINKNGKWIREVDDWIHMGDFSEGLLAFKDTEGRTSFENFYITKYGYMDTNGRVVIEPRFTFAQDFSEGLACVEIWGKMGYINTHGEYIWAPTN